jgi:agmatine deiminase
MPGEFEPHRQCWMLWPERADNWRLNAGPAQRAFADVAAAIARFEPVTIGVSTDRMVDARRQLPPSVRVVEIAHDDAWMRDVGPCMVVDAGGRLLGIDWEFNAWGGLHGGLYANWDQDAQVASAVLELEGIPRHKVELVMEGGSYHVDGEGTCLTTESCLLNPNRNPGWAREQIEVQLQDWLGVESVIWLKHGVHADETGGHIDNLCCFVRPGVVALTWTEDRSDPQWEISRESLDTLSSCTDARGRRLEVHTIHQPDPVTISSEESAGVARVDGTLPRLAGARQAASYINFYIANGGVIVPTFGDRHDRPALGTLAGLFPARAVVGVGAREVLLGGGGIHCITLQQPAG